MIKNLIFDFGKVLVDYNFEAIIDTFFDNADELAKFKQAIISLDFIDSCDKEDIPFAEIIHNAQKQYPQWEKELQMFYDRYIDYVTGEVPGMRSLLTRYRSKGYKLYGLTNWCSVVHQVIQKYDILQMLDNRIISSEEHLIKPDVAIYKRLCEKFGLKAEECLFTDDRLVNVEGARLAGMKAIVFKNAEQFEQELQQYL